MTLDGDTQRRWSATGVRPGLCVRHTDSSSPAADRRRLAADVALGLVLPCWTLLGMLDRALELTIAARQPLRKQFGQALSAFQGVQFQLTDAEVERSGVEVSRQVRTMERGAPVSPKRSSMRSHCECRPSKTAEVMLRVGHQLHGAVGFCDETDAVLAVPLQPAAASAPFRVVRDA